MNRIALATLTLLAAAAAPALAQNSNITGANKFSWSENGGWMNWRDAGSPMTSQGVFVSYSVLSGFVWMENFGWLNLGNGSPANGVAYANTTGTDFGVNLDPNTGYLTGLAWGENIGWVNFSAGAQKGEFFTARIAVDAPRRFYGYVWGENVGWINLDVAEEGKYVGVRTCIADFNQDGNLDPDDLGDYINCYFSVPPCDLADFNADGDVNPDDLGDFINAYFAGCN